MSMLSQSQRTAILELHDQGISKREIARVLNVSRLSVRKVLRSKSSALPVLVRPEKAEAYRIQILELLASHKGNLVRVHEELVSRGAEVSYPALTAFCRRHGIGQEPKVATGHYHFEPGEELQHDTSPHETEIAGKKRRIQTASAVLCYSRMVFFQCYPTFQRFDCKVFLTDALRYFGGSTARVMIDNTHVVVLRGTGAEMVPVPEMEAFGDRFRFRFAAVEGYVALHSSRYSVPVAWIGRRVEVREAKDKIEIQLDPRHIVTHQRVPEGENQRITLPEHRPPRGQGIKRTDPHPEEQAILQTAPELADYLAALKKRGHRYLTIALRQLLRIVRDYPRQPVLSAIAEAARYGLYDLDRLERMILRRIARDYFLLDEWKKGNPDEDQ